MPKTHPKVDAYIARAAPFARPILEHLRGVVHAAAPEVTEVVKWGMPFFDAGGPVCHIAAFKAHCSMGFWKGKLIPGVEAAAEGMGNLGKITSLAELPSDRVISGWVKAGVKLNRDGVKAPTARKFEPRPGASMHPDFAKALRADKAAKQVFDGFSASAKREYVDWIAEAKTDATREKRIASALEWIADGRKRNWKYEQKVAKSKQARRASGRTP